MPPTQPLEYSLPHLQSVYFAGFRWTEKHIESVLFVLRNAVALELMTIDASNVRCFNGTWRCDPNFDTATFETLKGQYHPQFYGERISKKAKVIIKPGVKGDFPIRELIAQV